MDHLQRLRAVLDEVCSALPEPEQWAYSPANAPHESSCVGPFPSRDAAVQAAREAGWGVARVGIAQRLELPAPFLASLPSDEARDLFNRFTQAARRVIDAGWVLPEDECKTVRTEGTSK